MSHQTPKLNSLDCRQSKPLCKRPAVFANDKVSISPRNVTKVEVGHPPSGERWFAVQSQPHREAMAAHHLRNQNFRVLLPLLSKTLRHARRVQIRPVPFFPGYLFIALDLDRDRWRSVNGTFGVQRLVMFGGESRPTPMPVGTIETIACQVDELGCLKTDEQFYVGQHVQILDGPFGRHMGELISLDDAGRVRVLIELLGTQTPATLSRKHIVAAG